MRLTLIVPGLLSSRRANGAGEDVLAAWTRSGATREHSGDMVSSLADLFGGEYELAPAPLTYLGLTGQAPRGWTVRADPVYLHPRRHQLVLLSAESLDLTDEYAARIAEVVDSVTDDHGLTLTALDKTHWVIAAQNTRELDTFDITAVSGRDIDRFLPRGRDSGFWMSLMNEVQMALHRSEVNQERARGGGPVVNSVWFWGGGSLPETPSPRSDRGSRTTMFSDDVLARGFANWHQIRLQSLPENYKEFDGETTGNAVFVFGSEYFKLALRNDDTYLAYLREWNGRWGSPLLQALSDGTIECVALIDPGSRTITLHKDRLQPWWRRIFALS